MITEELKILLITAASLGFVHTVTGPDHYLPFVAIAKARSWSRVKTAVIVTLCGLGHVGSSILLGIIGVVAGIGLNKLKFFEGSRGNIAAWLIIAFGLIYGLWGLRKAYHGHVHHHHGPKHKHYHEGQDHDHMPEESKDLKTSYKQLTPWILFIIFIFGPCEPLIPILIFPASEFSMSGVFLVAAIFGIVTIATMLLMVFAISEGVGFLRFNKLEKYSHALAGLTILLCGIGIQFFGL